MDNPWPWVRSFGPIPGGDPIITELSDAHKAQVDHATAGRRDVARLEREIARLCWLLAEANEPLCDRVNAASRAAVALVAGSVDLRFQAKAAVQERAQSAPDNDARRNDNDPVRPGIIRSEDRVEERPV
jgi:hypothetical protein